MDLINVSHEILERALEEIQKCEKDYYSAVEEHDFSEKFTKNMQKLISNTRKPYFRYINTIGKRVALLIVAIALSLTVTVATVKALREPVIEFIMHLVYSYTEITMDVAPDARLADLETTYEPSFMPSGYKKVSQMSMDHMRETIYKNSAGKQIIYAQYLPATTGFTFDAENTISKRVSINENNAYMFYFQKSGISLVWNYGKYTFFLHVEDYDEQTAIRIAESIKVSEVNQENDSTTVRFSLPYEENAWERTI